MNTGYQCLKADERVLVYTYKKPVVVEVKAAEFEEKELDSEDEDNDAVEDQSKVTYATIASLAENILSSEGFVESTCFDEPQTVLEKYSQFNVYRFSGDILKSQ